MERNEDKYGIDCYAIVALFVRVSFHVSFHVSMERYVDNLGSEEKFRR